MPENKDMPVTRNDCFNRQVAFFKVLADEKCRTGQVTVREGEFYRTKEGYIHGSESDCRDASNKVLMEMQKCFNLPS